MKIDTAEFILSANRPDQFPRDRMPEIAFVGRSNVGKSSLMNRLLRRKGLARTSKSPGRTRAVNYFLINRRFYFVDLPGYGFARAPKAERRRWGSLMEDYFQDSSHAGRAPRPATGGARSSLPPSVLRGEVPFVPVPGARRLLLQLVDSKVGATALDRQAIEYFRSLGLEPVIVATKIDRVPRSKRSRNLASIRRDLELTDGALPLAASAVSGEGVKQIWSGISILLEHSQERLQSVRTT